MIVLSTRYVSLASILGGIALPFVTYYVNGNILNVILTAFLGILILYRHKGNIKRLLSGIENRMKWPPKIEGSDSDVR